MNGRMKVNKVKKDGKKIIVRMVNKGDMLGFERDLKRKDYKGKEKEVMESIVIEWKKEIWDYLVEKNKGMDMKVIKKIGKRMEEENKSIREMQKEEVERRVENDVMRIQRKDGKKEEKGIRIDFKI